jgi:dolichyl-phosphate-mannose--protein O-mannosyl transferase
MELLQRPGFSMAEVRKGSTVFKTAIVVWLVLLVLALNVVAFVTRIIEKYRRPHDLSKPLERTVSVAQISQPSILKHQQSQPTQR